LTEKDRYFDREARWVTTSYRYSAVGNLVRVEDPTHRSTETVFDSVYQVYPVATFSSAEPTAQQTTTWDPVCGTPLQVTDPNNQASTFQWDALCRKAREDAPLGGLEIVSYHDFGQVNTERIVTEFPSAMPNGRNLVVEKYLDGDGRTYKTIASGPTTGQTIVSEVTFNARGRAAS